MHLEICNRSPRNLFQVKQMSRSHKCDKSLSTCSYHVSDIAEMAKARRSKTRRRPTAKEDACKCKPKPAGSDMLKCHKSVFYLLILKIDVSAVKGYKHTVKRLMERATVLM
jgi:hypothetical protein